MAGNGLSRRDFLRFGSLGALGAVGAAAATASTAVWLGPPGGPHGHGGHGPLAAAAGAGGAGSLAAAPGGGGAGAAGERMDAFKFLTHFDTGKVSRLADGRTLREYELVAEDGEVEVARGVKFPAWMFNGFVPGPTIRATEGDRLRIRFVNRGSHPHSIHFHGVHPPGMDGLEAVAPGGSFTYEFTADPAGVHLYHCHVMPLKRHIHKGLYGMFIVDPPGGRSPAREMAMVMNGYDLDLDGENEFYTVNGLAFAYQERPIQVRVGEPLRIYLANLTEFDLINSFHLHAEMFRYYPTGTRPEQHFFTDTVQQCQGERGYLEFSFRWPGRYMFHAHQSEFAELGWVGFFEAMEA